MTAASTGCFEHEAFLYGSDQEFVKQMGGFIQEGLEDDEAVFAVLDPAKTDLLRSALSPKHRDRISFLDAPTVYRQPARTLSQYDKLLRSLEGRHSRVVAEIEFGKSEEEWVAWTQYESLANRVLRDYPSYVVCTYDERILPESVVAGASCTHPWLYHRSPSGDYLHPEDLPIANVRLLTVPVEAPDLDVDLSAGLSRARREFAEFARGAGFGASRVDELTMGLSEIAANAVLHGGGEGRLRCWKGPDRRVLCAVDDQGPGTDPLTGLSVPQSSATSGRGVWLARQVFDRVELGGAEPGHRVLLRATPD